MAEQRPGVSAQAWRVPVKGQGVNPRVRLRQGGGVPSRAPCSSLHRGPVCVSARLFLCLNQAQFEGCHTYPDDDPAQVRAACMIQRLVGPGPQTGSPWLFGVSFIGVFFNLRSELPRGKRPTLNYRDHTREAEWSRVRSALLSWVGVSASVSGPQRSSWDLLLQEGGCDTGALIFPTSANSDGPQYTVIYDFG